MGKLKTKLRAGSGGGRQELGVCVVRAGFFVGSRFVMKSGQDRRTYDHGDEGQANQNIEHWGSSLGESEELFGRAEPDNR